MWKLLATTRVYDSPCATTHTLKSKKYTYLSIPQLANNRPKSPPFCAICVTGALRPKSPRFPLVFVPATHRRRRADVENLDCFVIAAPTPQIQIFPPRVEKISLQPICQHLIHFPRMAQKLPRHLRTLQIPHLFWSLSRGNTFTVPSSPPERRRSPRVQEMLFTSPS